MSRKQLSKSPTVRVVEKVNELGLSPAAQHFGVSAATLSRWLKAQKYMIKRIYVKEGEKAS